MGARRASNVAKYDYLVRTDATGSTNRALRETPHGAKASETTGDESPFPAGTETRGLSHAHQLTLTLRIMVSSIAMSRLRKIALWEEK